MNCREVPGASEAKANLLVQISETSRKNTYVGSCREALSFSIICFNSFG